MQLARRLSRGYITGCRQWSSPRVLNTSKLNGWATRFLYVAIVLPDRHTLYQSTTPTLSRQLSVELGQQEWKLNMSRVSYWFRKTPVAAVNKWLRRKSLVHVGLSRHSTIVDPVSIHMTLQYASLVANTAVRITFVVVSRPGSNAATRFGELATGSICVALHIPLRFCDDMLQTVRQHIEGKVRQ